jgi:hypothetical protein
MNLFNSDDNDDDGKYWYIGYWLPSLLSLLLFKNSIKKKLKLNIIYYCFNVYDHYDCYLDEDYMVDLNYDSDAKDSVNSDLELGIFMLFL